MAEGNDQRIQPWLPWYGTARWKRLRLAIRQRDGFTCQMCGRLDGAKGQLICDHKQPHRGDQRLFWDEANLWTICKPCHDGLKQKQEQASKHKRGVWY